MTGKNFSFDQHKLSSFLFCFFLPEKQLNRDTKLIAIFQTAILHYIDGVGRKYILRIGRSREATERKVLEILLFV